jgi:hypothetical protein
MRLLFTNNTLKHFAGTELSLRDAALEMQKRGHTVGAFSTQLGAVGDFLRENGVSVVGELSELPWEPEVIHGQHEWETSMAALSWPEVPVISFCRGSKPWQEAPCLAPNVVRYVAVDEDCHQRLLMKHQIDENRIVTILNGVDLEKFQLRGANKAGKRVLVYSNYATEENYASVVREACAKMGYECDVIGAGVKKTVSDPENVLGQYDIVFAKGKAALEALACGCAVIVADEDGLGPSINEGNFERARSLSFGFPLLTEGFTVEAVISRLREFDEKKHGEFVARIRHSISHVLTMDQLESLYREVLEQKIETEVMKISRFAEMMLSRSALSYKLGRKLYENYAFEQKGENMVESEFDRVFDQYVNVHKKLIKAEDRANRLRGELDAVKMKLAEQKSEKSEKKDGFFKKLF